MEIPPSGQTDSVVSSKLTARIHFDGMASYLVDYFVSGMCLLCDMDQTEVLTEQRRARKPTIVCSREAYEIDQSTVSRTLHRCVRRAHETKEY